MERGFKGKPSKACSYRNDSHELAGANDRAPQAPQSGSDAAPPPAMQVVDGLARVPSSDYGPPSPGRQGGTGHRPSAESSVSSSPPQATRAGPSHRKNSLPADGRAEEVAWPPARLGAPWPPPGSPDSEASSRVCVTWAPVPVPHPRDGSGQGGRGG